MTEHDPHRLRAVARADAAEAQTEAANRDAVTWSLNVETASATNAQARAAAAYGLAKADLWSGAALFVRTVAVLLILVVVPLLPGLVKAAW